MARVLASQVGPAVIVPYACVRKTCTAIRATELANVLANIPKFVILGRVNANAMQAGTVLRVHGRAHLIRTVKDVVTRAIVYTMLNVCRLMGPVFARQVSAEENAKRNALQIHSVKIVLSSVNVKMARNAYQKLANAYAQMVGMVNFAIDLAMKIVTVPLVISLVTVETVPLVILRMENVYALQDSRESFAKMSVRKEHMAETVKKLAVVPCQILLIVILLPENVFVNPAGSV